MSQFRGRASVALMAIAVIAVTAASTLWLMGHVARPGPLFAGAGAVFILAIAARRRKGAG